MTREEVIKILKEEIAICKYNLYDSPRSDYLGQADRNIFHSRIKAFEMAIEALEQEPSDDAVSRQAVLELVADYDLSMGQVVRGIHALPSVNPQERKGHWIRYKENCCYNKCSICEYEHCTESNYCPNCGARMEKVRNNL